MVVRLVAVDDLPELLAAVECVVDVPWVLAFVEAAVVGDVDLPADVVGALSSLEDVVGLADVDAGL